ncbi:hypothetical protein KAI04_02460 [Candidatus Pacearchaeota archaeon]|nr:hypothetical protein [Candidatus Pacearchaeota archaeon]
MKKISGFILLILAFIVFFFEKFSVTGNIIKDNFNMNFLPLNLIVIGLLLASILIFTSKKSLDYLLIPDGSEGLLKKRKQTTIKEFERREGNIKKVYIMKGKDSEEDILKLGKMLKGGERVGIVTFPEHYLEYRELIRKAKRDHRFPKFVKVKKVNTREPGKDFPEKWYNLKESIYGHLGLWEEKLKKRKLDYVENRNDKFYRKFKNVIKKIIGL